MQPAPKPADEGARLDALRALAVLDSEPEERFDRLTRLAQDLFDAPIALVSLVDSERQWFKSRIGLDATETPREVSFCAHAILDDDVFVIRDALADPRFADNPLVLGDPDIRFYAGAPLSTTEGQAIGTLCVIDTKPREWSPDESKALRDLADVVEDELNQVRLQNQQRALLALTAVTALSLDDQREQLRTALRLGCDFLGLPLGIVSHIVDDDYEVLVQVSPPDTLADGQHFSLGNTYCHLTLQSDDVLAIADMKNSQYASHPCYESFGLESYIGVPIIVDGLRFGTLNFSSPDPRPFRRFSEADVDFVRLLGRWVATTLRRWQLDQELRQQQQISRVIGRAQAQFIRQSDRNAAFDSLLADILDLTGCGYGFIGEVLHRPDGRPFLQTRALTNIAWNDETRALYDANLDNGMEFDNLHTLFGVTLSTGEPVISNDPYGDPRRGGLPDGHPRMDSYAGLPVHHGDRLIAMLGLANKPGGFDVTLVDFLAPLVATIGQLVEASRIKREHEDDQQAIARLSMVASQMTNGVLITDIDGVIEWVNDGFSRMSGYAPDELLGRRPRAVLHGPESDPATVQAIIESMTDRRPFQHELLAYAKDGRSFWVELDSNPLFGDDGTCEGFMVMASDITDRKRVERMKSEFVSTVSHELRTPLTAISGALGLVTGGVAGPIPPPAMDMITIAHNNSNRLTLLIDDLLDMEKLVEGKVRFDTEVQDLMPIIDHAITDNQAYADHYHVTIIGTDRADGTHVDVDSLRLLQVLANLISNAAKFSPAGSTVEIRVHHHNTDARIDITDHGPGIPEAYHASIFDKFSQIDASDSRQRGGTGLGLAITKELVERMGGHISLDSHPGHGTTFHIDLPTTTDQPTTTESRDA